MGIASGTSRPPPYFMSYLGCSLIVRLEGLSFRKKGTALPLRPSSCTYALYLPCFYLQQSRKGGGLLRTGTLEAGVQEVPSGIDEAIPLPKPWPRNHNSDRVQPNPNITIYTRSRTEPWPTLGQLSLFSRNTKQNGRRNGSVSSPAKKQIE